MTIKIIVTKFRGEDVKVHIMDTQGDPIAVEISKINKCIDDFKSNKYQNSKEYTTSEDNTAVTKQISI